MSQPMMLCIGFVERLITAHALACVPRWAKQSACTCHEEADKLNVIPVIDLKGGEVVRAQRGERHLYAPIRTPLAQTSRPTDVVAGFLALNAFRTMYIADLDAIEGKGNHSACLAQLEAAFPEVTFWVDAGIGTKAQAAAWLNAHRSDLVLGSESLRDEALYTESQ